MATVHSVGDVINGFLIDKGKLGSGGFTMFYHAQKGGREIFLKQYKSPSITVDWFNAYLEYEKKIKKYIESGPIKDNTYEIIDIFAWNNTIYQAMEFVPNRKDLSDFLNDFGEDAPGSCRFWDKRVIFAKMLMDCIKKLHASHLVHCDLKPENVVLIEDKSIKTGYLFRVADMDWSFIEGENPPWVMDMGYMGTDGYRSPEHIRKERPTFASDVFTCGIILYEILCNDSPFSIDDYNNEVLNYKPAEPVLLGNYPDADNDVICQLLKDCLNPDPTKRPSAAEVHSILLGRGTTSGFTTRASRPGETVRPATRPDLSTPSVASTPKPEPPVSPTVSSIQLVGPLNTLKANIKTVVGKPTLRSLCGEDGQYAATVQYTLVREGDSWFIEPNPDATNETMLNGKMITEKTPLKPGDQIGVGREAKGIVKAIVTVQ